MFFDTETTGKPRAYKAPMAQLDNWPRVVQLAWSISDPAGITRVERSHMIKPDGWTVSTEQFFLDHNLSTERCEAEGSPLAGVLDEFLMDLQDCEWMVSHNLEFDYNVLGSELIRAGKRSARKPRRICTKEASTQWCAIPFEGARRYPGSRQSFKWPKLEELHHKLFSRPFENAHDALGDVRALRDCFFGLVQHGVIDLST